MGKVILDMAMSLDGFAGGPNGEDRGLNDWFFSPAGRSREIVEESIASTGAIVMAGGPTVWARRPRGSPTPPTTRPTSC